MTDQIKVISGRQYPANVIPIIDEAKISIDIVVFDWRWYPNNPGASCQLFNQAILRAVRRGVKIRVITNNDGTINILKKEGVEAKKVLTTRLVHAKALIVDSEIVVTGSHNFTQSAFQMNFELSVIIGPEIPKQAFVSFFENLLLL